jgi:nucleoside diphosphate kinase
MSKESLIMTKPDPRKSEIQRAILNECSKKGLGVYLLGEKKLTIEDVYLIYDKFIAENWFKEFADYITSKEVSAYVTEGNDAVEKTLEVRNEIRNRYAEDRKKNAVHAPKEEESVEEYLRKFKIIFDNGRPSVIDRLRFRRSTGFDIPIT